MIGGELPAVGERVTVMTHYVQSSRPRYTTGVALEERHPGILTLDVGPYDENFALSEIREIHRTPDYEW